ncbi:very short patch repair endonuclease [Silvimonas amylolytica]|uniref:Very short patch repair endonuclease n=1 Tax=Silvimonas amylolytica TaxID=449663 RepID=A0ABQ2PK36_9NEIS|nr:very short patch repair endonuclease [Silvimonas amylolytica]GGP25817.1 very short patch repair endonuclease [Silvimonas amylolytica]
MTDVVDAATRSRMMSGIRGKNTSPEITLRKALFARGFRYRIHVPGLPGKPDLVLPRYHAVILVHGCFWHGHDCRYFKVPQTRTEFWMGKINSNRARDRREYAELKALGWRVLVVWECAVRATRKDASFRLVDFVAEWLTADAADAEISETGVKGLVAAPSP